MTKQEFLDRLGRTLHGKVSPGQVVENLQFYEDYINTEVRKGATEEEVMASLGDPRLLARTIAETQGSQSSEYAGGSRNGNRREERDGAWYGEPEGMDGAWYRAGEGSGGTRFGKQDGAWHGTREKTPDGAWYGNAEGYQPDGNPRERHLRVLSKIPAWAWLMLALLVVVLAVSAVFSLLAALLPILLPILIVLFMVKAFRDWIH